jgi:hypothetical protein
MSEILQQIGDQWRDRSKDLASWTMQNLVNRTDVWGRYMPLQSRKDADGKRNHAVTAPFRDERRKVFLKESSLVKHYRTHAPGGQLGLHSVAADGTSRWFAIDVDLHDEDNYSVTPEGNFVAARGWWDRLQQLGFDPLLMDSNGAGGYHILVVFATPMCSKSVYRFTSDLVSDFERRGLDVGPDLFPGKGISHHYGSWLRLPGRHHTRGHYTRIWNDEPGSEHPWLEGHDAIDRILHTQLTNSEHLESLGFDDKTRTICIDFDGVIHSYLSGWRGEAVIPDPPIHRTAEAIVRLRKHFRVVVHSARCCSHEGRQAIREWLELHNIEVDDVCEHKPPAMVYLDDRGVPFTGDWDQAIADIHSFRK